MMRKGVSLIELMVVMAILAILMAILMPVYSRALHQANGGVCIENLSQIHKALALYSNDYDGGRLGSDGVVYPPSLVSLHLPPKTIGCRDHALYEIMWSTNSPVLVVDRNSGLHQGRVLGLFVDGHIERRGGEGNALDPAFWR